MQKRTLHNNGHFFSKRINRAGISLLLAMLLPCCDKPKNSNSEDTKAPSTSQDDISDSGFYDEIKRISKAFLPASLKNSIQNNLFLAGSSPCDVIQDDDKMLVFLKCQPILLQHYLLMAELFIDEIAIWSDEIGEKIRVLKAGSESQTNLEEGETLFVKKRMTPFTKYSSKIKRERCFLEISVPCKLSSLWMGWRCRQMMRREVEFTRAP